MPVPVAASCGGCPGCRALGLPAHRYAPPAPFPARSTAQAWSDRPSAVVRGHRALVVLYDATATDGSEDMARTLERLARSGMWCLMAPSAVLESSAVRDLHRIAPGRAIFHLDRWDQLRAPLLPTALVYEPGATVPADALEEGGPQRVVLVEEGARDPRHATAADPRVSLGGYERPATYSSASEAWRFSNSPTFSPPWRRRSTASWPARAVVAWRDALLRRSSRRECRRTGQREDSSTTTVRELSGIGALREDGDQSRFRRTSRTLASRERCDDRS